MSFQSKEPVAWPGQCLDLPLARLPQPGQLDHSPGDPLAGVYIWPNILTKKPTPVVFWLVVVAPWIIELLLAPWRPCWLPARPKTSPMSLARWNNQLHWVFVWLLYLTHVCLLMPRCSVKMLMNLEFTPWSHPISQLVKLWSLQFQSCVSTCAVTARRSWWEFLPWFGLEWNRRILKC